MVLSEAVDREGVRVEAVTEKLGKELGDAYLGYVFGDDYPIYDRREERKGSVLELPAEGLLPVGKFAELIAEKLGSTEFNERKVAVEALLSAIELRQRRLFPHRFNKYDWERRQW